MKHKKGLLLSFLVSLTLCCSIPSLAKEEEQKSMDVSATVAATEASYYVDVPSDIQIGTISADEDMVRSYQIAVDADGLSTRESVTITSESSIELTNQDNSAYLPCYNDFAEQTFQASGAADGTLTIYQKDIAKLSKGSYSGTLHFQITYTRKSTTDSDIDQNDDTIKYGSVKINKPGISGATVTGLATYAAAKKEGAYAFTIQRADSVDDKDGISAIASLISAGGENGSALYYNFSLSCQTESETHFITDTQKYVMEIGIPMTTTSVSNAVGYRFHDGTVSLMQALSERPSGNYVDNTYYCDLTNGYFYFYSSKFSVFAIQKNAATTTTGSTTSTTTSASILDVDTETAFTASLSLRKSTDFSSTSMCDPLFYEYADLVVNGDTAKLTLYVIDPIPNYVSEGTPLSNVSFRYDGTSYSASVDSSNQVIKAYDAASGFISTAGNYNSSKITVSLPTDAIKESADGELMCSAYVNAVMKSTQSFYVVLSDFAKGSTKSETTTTAITTTTTKTTANSLNKSDGLYQLPVTAIKEKTDDTSMMADYMYPYADLEIAGTTYTLTLYIQHTVAGIEAGGPKYLKYDTTQAVKTDNAVTYDGVSYDSFTLTLDNTFPNPMMVTMYINAMSIEVKARLVFNTDAMTLKTSDDTTDTAAKTETASTTAAASSSRKSSSAKSVTQSDSKQETTVETAEAEMSTDTQQIEDTVTPQADTIAEAAAPNGYLLVTDAFAQVFIYLAVTLLTVGAVVVRKYVLNRK